MALVAPRLTLVLLALVSDYVGDAFSSWLWPLLGFLFLPVTTLAYAWAVHETEGHVRGLPLAIVVLAVLIDLGLFRQSWAQRSEVELVIE